jgi:hypothetical protein
MNKIVRRAAEIAEAFVEGALRAIDPKYDRICGQWEALERMGPPPTYPRPAGIPVSCVCREDHPACGLCPRPSGTLWTPGEPAGESES